MTERGKSRGNPGTIFTLFGSLMTLSFSALAALPSLRGGYIPAFLVAFSTAFLAYLVAVLRLRRDQPSLTLIWGFGLLFQVIMLFTLPSLSDDIYRYLWDGHLLNQGLNPYALPVNHPTLDAYETSFRALVNHDWMASPYLPTTQLVFAGIARLAPQSTLAFQVAAVVFNLLTAWIIVDLLRRLGLPQTGLLVYLWNPLIVVEFAHGGHIDALMLALLMLAVWFLIRGRTSVTDSRLTRRPDLSTLASAFSLGAATLTKFLPMLILPLFLRRWSWKGLLTFITVVLVPLIFFAFSAGWGLTGPLDGTGVFGATRIYLRWWNFNGGLYHWLEVFISGYRTPGAVPAEVVGETPILIAKGISSTLLGLSVLLAGWLAWQTERDSHNLLRIPLLPLGAYLLLTPTLHPWYLTLIFPFLPFLAAYKKNRKIGFDPLVWPWLYLSWGVSFSYLTYMDPTDFRELGWVRLVEYIPSYLLLAGSLVHHFLRRKKGPNPII